MKRSLILASGSPRRKELLGHLEIPFEIVVSHIDEHSSESEPKLFGEDIATQKGRAVYEELALRPGFGTSFLPFVVAADTLVALKGKIYGKPKNTAEAREILRELSGQTHEVVSAVMMSEFDLETRKWHERVFSISTMVSFAELSEDILENYLASGDSLDKAGAYGIQGQGLTFVHRLEGSYSNVVGFPLSDFIHELRSFIASGDGAKDEWRNYFVRT